MKKIQNFFQTTVSYTFHHRTVVSIVLLVGSILLWGPTIYANLSTRSIRYELTKPSLIFIPKRAVAVVFGSGVYKNGQPSPYLRWRVETAVQLYRARRVQKILMTGDNSRAHYDEPTVMRTLAIQLGVPSKDIVLDYAGFSTYESCYRAHAIFKLTSATLVSQGYHLPRALLACNAFGLHAIGVNAVHPGKSWSVTYIVREWLSTAKIVVQLVFKPKPTFLGPVEPIIV